MVWSYCLTRIITRYNSSGGGLWRAELAKAIQRFNCRGRPAACRLADARADSDDTAEHLNKRTGDGEIAPVRISCGVEQDDAPFTVLSGGHDRCAISQTGPGQIGQFDGWLGQYLFVDQYIFIFRQIRKRGLALKWRKGGRGCPGEYTA